MQRANHVVSRRAIDDAVYGEDADISLNAIDAAVLRLCRTLDAHDADVRLQTIRGIGWMLLDRSNQ